MTWSSTTETQRFLPTSLWRKLKMVCEEGLRIQIQPWQKYRHWRWCYYTVDDKSDMEVKKIKNDLGFRVDKESGDAATVQSPTSLCTWAEAWQQVLTICSWIQQVPMNSWSGNSGSHWSEGREAKVKYQYYNNDDNFKHVVKEGFVNITQLVETRMMLPSQRR